MSASYRLSGQCETGFALNNTPGVASGSATGILHQGAAALEPERFACSSSAALQGAGNGARLAFGIRRVAGEEQRSGKRLRKTLCGARSIDPDVTVRIIGTRASTPAAGVAQQRRRLPAHQAAARAMPSSPLVAGSGTPCGARNWPEPQRGPGPHDGNECDRNSLTLSRTGARGRASAQSSSQVSAGFTLAGQVLPVDAFKRLNFHN